MQLTFENKTIDQLAIELIQAYEPLEGYYLGFSGGKDSVVIYDLAKRSGVKFEAHYSVSPIDPPQVHKFIKEYYTEITWEYYAREFFNKLVISNGLPMRSNVGHGRWCCKLIKEAGGIGKVKILGMRREESSGRSKYTCFKEMPKDTKWLLPIVNWQDSDVWQYISEHELPVNPLYREGFTRIGCVLCPYHTKDQTKFEIEKFPKLANCWKQAAFRYYEKRTERGTPLTNYGSKEDFWNWWIKRS